MKTHDALVIGAGQSGLAAAYAFAQQGIRPLVLDQAPTAGGSWSRYYQSLSLFSPAGFSSLPGFPFPGDKERYPGRDEVVSYLTEYADSLDADFLWNQQVTSLYRNEDAFEATTSAGVIHRAQRVVVASGNFDSPHTPQIPGLSDFQGRVLHSSEYLSPEPFAGQRVLVVGGGNSGVQIAVELAATARVSLVTRNPVRWQRQRMLGKDLHWWLAATGIDRMPWAPRSVPVVDSAGYRRRIADRHPEQRGMFHRLHPQGVDWGEGTVESVDALIFATGFRPNVQYLAQSGALDPAGMPLHAKGVSTTVPRLGFVGLEGQRTFASATLRGVGRDARHVVNALL